MKLLLMLPFLASSIFFFIYPIKMRYRVRRSMSWPSVEGRIVDSSVRMNSPYRWPHSYLPIVEYTYTAKGGEYSSRRMFAGYRSDGMTKKKAQAILAGFREDPTVTVYYDPDKPSFSCLIRETHGTAIFFMFSIFIFLFPLLLIMGA